MSGVVEEVLEDRDGEVFAVDDAEVFDLEEMLAGCGESVEVDIEDGGDGGGVSVWELFEESGDGASEVRGWWLHGCALVWRFFGRLSEWRGVGAESDCWVAGLCLIFPKKSLVMEGAWA